MARGCVGEVLSSEKRPGKAGPMGLEERYSMKFGSPSSGCETHSAKAQARQADSEPCDCCGNGASDA